MKKLITSIMLFAAVAWSQQAGQDKKADTDISNLLYGPIESGCMYPNEALAESKKGIEALEIQKFDSAYLHLKKAHDLCPDNDSIEELYKQIDEYLRNRTRYRT